MGYGPYFASPAFELNAPPSSPTFTAPLDGTFITLGLSYDLQWTPATDLDDPVSSLRYNIRHRTTTSGAFSDIPNLPENVGGNGVTTAGATSFTIDTSFSDNTYFGGGASWPPGAVLRQYVIRAHDGAEFGDDSGILTVYYNPLYVNITSPIEGETIPLDEQISVAWTISAPVPDLRYNIQYKSPDDPDFIDAPGLPEQGGAGDEGIHGLTAPNATSFTFPYFAVPNPGGTWSLRVRAFDNTAFGPFTTITFQRPQPIKPTINPNVPNDSRSIIITLYQTEIIQAVTIDDISVTTVELSPLSLEADIQFMGLKDGIHVMRIESVVSGVTTIPFLVYDPRYFTGADGAFDKQTTTGNSENIVLPTGNEIYIPAQTSMDIYSVNVATKPLTLFPFLRLTDIIEIGRVDNLYNPEITVKLLLRTPLPTQIDTSNIFIWSLEFGEWVATPPLDVTPNHITFNKSSFSPALAGIPAPPGAPVADMITTTQEELLSPHHPGRPLLRTYQWPS